jgi:hypothetical protein
VETTTAVLAVLLGLGLSASTGLNTFIPLLLLSAAARFNLAGVELGTKFDWLSSDIGLTVLIVASIAEIVADKVPAVDHLLDSVGTFIRPVAATIASAAVLTGANVDPTVAAVVGFVVGTPTSLAFHTVKAGTRVASSATTLGCANPVLSLIEDVFSAVFSMLAIFLPLVVPFVLAIAVWLLWRTWKRTRGSAAPAGFVPPTR